MCDVIIVCRMPACSVAQSRESKCDCDRLSVSK